MPKRTLPAYCDYVFASDRVAYPYRGIKHLVREYQRESPRDALLTLAAIKPFSPSNLHLLVQEGWVIKDEYFFIGCCDSQKREIRIRPSCCKGIQRDLTLAHELVHAWYGDASDDYGVGWIGIYRRALVELFGRHMVASPQWMEEMLSAFDLSPQSYDRREHRSLLPPSPVRPDVPLTLSSLLQSNHNS